ncbi:hypothetical protein NDU88_006960 [Pleurodeles waltl]|uniref:Uncharacterized protein n=1 Tax=Pleurodeles waltl TaxID=8319 RepID=A0AAV7NWM8_PLEWA|nr:hypothetical protein NDU88_006960 [Pleurodeles waltl]
MWIEVRVGSGQCYDLGGASYGVVVGHPGLPQDLESPWKPVDRVRTGHGDMLEELGCYCTDAHSTVASYTSLGHTAAFFVFLDVAVKG